MIPQDHMLPQDHIHLEGFAIEQNADGLVVGYGVTETQDIHRHM